MEILNSIVAAFWPWLWRASLHASILIVLVIAIQFLLHDRLAARWRHALWLLVAIRLVLPWGPESQVSIYNLFQFMPGTTLAASLAPDTIAFSGFVGETSAESTNSNTDATEITLPAVSPIGPLADTGSSLGFWAMTFTWLPLIWLVGAVGLAICVLAQSISLMPGVARLRLVTDQGTLDILEDCKEKMGVAAYLALVETPRVESPALFGFVRPRLLLPPGMIASLGPDRLRHIFLHELAHLKRHDVALAWATTALQILHWFNPLVWLAFHRMRAERELACDALALSRTEGEESAEYGRTVVALFKSFSPSRHTPSLAGVLEENIQIERRINMIARFNRNGRPWPVFAVILVAALACVGLTEAKSDRTDRNPLPAADIVIDDFKLRPYPEGGLYRMMVSLRNTGETRNPGFEMAFYRCYPEEPGKLVTRGKNGAGPIEPGAVFNGSCLPFALTEGVNPFAVVIDPEGSELRSEFEVRVKDGKIVNQTMRSRTDPRAVENIVIDNIIIQPYPEGGLHTLTVILRNTGQRPNTGCEIVVHRGEVEQSRESVFGGVNWASPIEPGKTSRVFLSPFALAEGVNPFHIIVDPIGAALRATFEVEFAQGRIVDKTLNITPRVNLLTQAPFVIEDFEINSYPDGGLYTLVVSLRNLGKDSIKGFEVLFHRGDPDKGAKTIHGAVNWAGPIESGDIFREACSSFALKDGLNEFTVIADPNGVALRKTLKITTKNDKIVKDHKSAGR